ncbi:MAG: hypothetical protein ABIO57_01995 [Candidatus Paceibacterota bacterium]
MEILRWISIAVLIVGIVLYITIRSFRTAVTLDVFIGIWVPYCLNNVDNDHAASAVEALIIKHGYNKHSYIVCVHPFIPAVKLQINKKDYFFKKIKDRWQRSTEDHYLM